MDEDARARVRCVQIGVAETAGRPEGRRLQLQAAVVAPRGAPQGPPLLYLHGGPGGLAIGAYRWFMREPFGPRVAVLLDQRASGLSTPQLCPQLREADLQVLVRGLNADAETAARLPLFRACRDALRKEGVDLAAYTAHAVVHDAEALRKALGIAQWDVLGISFGTRVGLAYLDVAPQSIRAMVLDSVTPPGQPTLSAGPANLMRAVSELDALCSRDAACAARFGSLEASFVAAIEQTHRQPLRLPSDDPIAIDGALRISAPTLLVALHQLLYDREFYPILPLIVALAREGDSRALRNLAAPLLEQTRRGDRVDTYTAFECHDAYLAEGLAPNPADGAGLPPILSQMTGAARWATDICPMWRDGEPGTSPIVRVVAANTVPVLVLAGAVDPVTPPAGSKATAASLGALYAELPHTGHGAVLEPCGKQIASVFLAEPLGAVDTHCTTEERAIPFITSAVLAPAVGLLGRNLFERPSVRWISGMLATVVLLASVAVWPLLRRRRISAADGPAWQRPAPVIVLTAGTLLVFITGLMAAIGLTATQLPVLLVLGLPTTWTPLFFLPWLALAGLVWSALLLATDRGEFRRRFIAPLVGSAFALGAAGALGLLLPRWF